MIYIDFPSNILAALIGYNINIYLIASNIYLLSRNINTNFFRINKVIINKYINI